MKHTAHRAQVLPERHYTAPQGRVSQGWPARRCTPEEFVRHIQDRMPEDFDKPEPVVGKESVKVWAWLMTPGVAVLAGLCAWAWVRLHA